MLTQAPVQAVEHQGQRNPLAHHVLERRARFGKRISDVVTQGCMGVRDGDARLVAGCRLQQVDHVQVMGPCLGPVFPGVGCGVGAHVACSPVAEIIAPRVVRVQCSGVVLALIAKHLPKCLNAAAIAHELIPVEVTRLVPKVPDERAVRLTQGNAAAGPFVVGTAAGWLLASVALDSGPRSLAFGAVVVASTVVVGMLLRRVAAQGTAPSFVVVATVVLAALLLGWRLVARLLPA